MIAVFSLVAGELIHVKEITCMYKRLHSGCQDACELWQYEAVACGGTTDRECRGNKGS